MYASNSHSYTHLILALGIVREPTAWVLNFITSQYPGIHDIGLPTDVRIRHNIIICDHGLRPTYPPIGGDPVVLRHTEYYYAVLLRSHRSLRVACYS